MAEDPTQGFPSDEGETTDLPGGGDPSLLEADPIDRAPTFSDGETMALSGHRVDRPEDILLGPTEVLPASQQVLPRAPLDVGDCVADRYLIEGAMGQGGFGRVFRAFDQLLTRRVALKEIVGIDTSAGAGKRVSDFLREAKAAGRLDHPNIVPVYDAGTFDGRSFIVMKLVEGRDLASLLEEEGPLSRERTLSFLRQMALALRHAHRKRVVHRDIKPNNVLIQETESGEHLLLTDFGLAKILQPSLSSGSRRVVGTPCYMSPEQITGKAVDERSDLFSLGCVAVELLTGRRPFGGGSFSEILYSIVHQQPRGIEAIDRGRESSLRALVESLLAKSPEDRLPSVSSLLKALDELDTDAEPKTAGPSILSRLWRRREPRAWDGLHTLSVLDLHKKFGFKKQVLAGVDLTVERGSIYGLLGRNGAGKSTLIRTLLAILRRDSGEVRIFGRDPEKEGPAIFGRLGYVADTLTVFEWMTVDELINFLRHSFEKWDNAYGYKLAKRYELPLDSRIQDLSQGMKTKLALVAALGHRPELLVLDDPTLGLDAIVVDELLETLLEVARQEGTTVLFSSHHYEEMERVATDVGFLSGGKIALAGRLEALRQRMRRVQVSFEGGLPRSIEIRGLRVIDTREPTMTGLIVGRRESVLRSLRELGPSQLHEEELSLKEIFRAVLG